MYKLLVLDIDGTLTNSSGEITENTVNTLVKAQEAGVKIVLASGRPTYGILPVAEKLHMEQFGGYILSFNGGKIIDLVTKEVFFETTLDKELIPALYSAAKGGDSTILTYCNDQILTENPDDEHVKIEVGITQMKPCKVDSFVEAVGFAPDKCLIVGEPDNIIPVGERLNALYGDKIGAYRSYPFFLEVVPKGIDKALSLARLLERVGGVKEELIAIGDGFNDQSMIEFAGLGVAMANAQESVREAADFVTLSNDNEGVAHVVDKFLLGK